MSDVNDQVDENISPEVEQPAPEAVDPVKNLKSEFSRKFDNTNSRLEQLNQQLAQMMETLQSSSKPSEPAKPLKDLAFDDPEEYARIVEERATKRAEEKVTKQFQLSQATQNVVADIQNKYPEFAQQGSEASQLAIQKAAQLPPHLRGTPEGAKIALMDAVAELGLVPASRRQSKSSGDDFTLSGQSKPTSKRPSDPAKDIDPNTLAWMDLLDPSFKNDPKRVENLKNISKRKSWTKYE